MRRIGIIAAVVGTLCGCATQSSVRLTNEPLSEGKAEAVFWSRSQFNIGWRYPDNDAYVKTVDTVAIGESVSYVELAPGPHVAEVLHRRHHFCIWELLAREWGYPNCYRPEGITRLEWTAESGRSYMAFAFHYCDKNWVWIEDTGNSASEDIKKLKSYPLAVLPVLHLADDVRSRPRESRRVMAGEAPPERCGP